MTRENGSDTNLIQAALDARESAYVPYSKFRVGAALLDERGRVFTGCNIENASYGATCCAERTAIFKAVSEGAKAIRKLAVVCGQEGPCMPCGICRQVMAEFAANDFILLAASPDGTYRRFSLDELLPARFELSADPSSGPGPDGQTGPRDRR